MKYEQYVRSRRGLSPSETVVVRHACGLDAEIFKLRVFEAVPKPATDDFSIVVLTAGQAETMIDYGHGRFLARGYPGMSGVAPPNYQADLSGGGDYHMTVLVCPHETVRRHFERQEVVDFCSFGPLHAAPSADPLVGAYVHQMTRHAEAGSPHGRLYSETLLHRLIARLAALSGLSLPEVDLRLVGGLGQRTLTSVCEMMHDFEDESVTIENLADYAGLTVSHFIRCFKNSTGRTPHAYRIRCRVQRVCGVLRSQPSLSLSVAATDAGFADQSHLNRHFKRQLGVTPGQWLEAGAAACSRVNRTGAK